MRRPWPVLLPLIACLVLILAGWAGGPHNSFDVTLVAEAVKFRAHEPALTTVPAALTQLGSAYFLIPLSAVVILMLYAVGRRRSALLMFLTVAGERLLLDGLKILIQRPRPELDAHPVLTHSFSFPSGHAANTMTVLVAIALFALPQRYRWWTLPIAIGLAAMIGATRPWLGVHWPSDIIGGWMLAALSISGALWTADRFDLSEQPVRTKA